MKEKNYDEFSAVSFSFFLVGSQRNVLSDVIIIFLGYRIGLVKFSNSIKAGRTPHTRKKKFRQTFSNYFYVSGRLVEFV
jgi:hypothetical protein